MGEPEKWAYVNELDEDLLKGGAVLSEWCAFIVRDADTAFVSGAHLSVILTVVSGIETHLRSEYADSRRSSRVRLHQLIDEADIDEDLRADLHSLRRYRNRWVHVDAPWADEELLENPLDVENELEAQARHALRTLRRVIYSNPMV